MSVYYHLSLAQNLSEFFVKILKSRSFGGDDLLDLRPVCSLWTINFFFIYEMHEMHIQYVFINQSSYFQTVVRGRSFGGTPQI